MTTKKSNAPEMVEQKNEVLTIQERAIQEMQSLKNLTNSQFTPLTSNIMKMQDGEVFNGIIFKDSQMVDDEDGNPYPAYKGLSVSEESVLVADVVVVKAFDRYFEANNDVDFVKCRLINKGDIKTSDGKRTYRNISVLVL